MRKTLGRNGTRHSRSGPDPIGNEGHTATVAFGLGRIWMVRSLVLGAAHATVRAVLGFVVARAPEYDTLLRVAAVLVLVAVAFAWGMQDGRATGAQPADLDPTLTWLKTAALAAVLAGASTWIVGYLSTIGVGRNSLFFELTSGAAFTLLLVFLPAVLAIAVSGRRTKPGRGRGRRGPRAEPPRSGNLTETAAGLASTNHLPSDPTAHCE